jgi:hypothetical protein
MSRTSQFSRPRHPDGRRLLAASALVVLVTAVGCTHQPDSASPDPSAPPTPAPHTAQSAPARITLACDGPIAGSRAAPDAPARLILGTVALGELPRILPVDARGDGPTLYAKVGLWIHAGHRASLAVARTSGAEILWRTNNPGPRAPTVDVPACPATDLGSWLVYPGGFYVSAPSCVALIVTVGKESETVHVPVGRTCPS